MERGLRCGVIFLTILSFFISKTSQNTRNKRQIQPELPRILTQNGHLVFQTGTNHNISFTSTNGGFINVNGENLAVISQTVKNNKLAIDQLQTSPTASSGIASRVTTIENRLNNLQPTGQVQTQLLTLGHRIDLLQTTIPENLNSRLTQIETSLQSSDQVQDLINGLTTRVTRVERRVRRNTSSRAIRRSIRRVTRRVTRLQTTVENLQNLLTVDECDSNPCQNGGTCVDTYNGYLCQCPASFQGQNCQTDVNECAIYAGTDLGCQNGATCTNTIGSFTCQCATNWHGIRCTESHDDCTGASSSELCGHGTCVNVARTQPGQAKYTCICDDGWTSASGSDPACTVDVNECTMAGRPVCSVDPPVTCINLPGTFTCGACPAGYNGNGFSCVDINECAVNNGGCSMSPMVDCINTAGSRECGPCPEGFQGTGTSCTWVGMCQDNNGGCYPTASCTESPGFQGRTCTCPPGYVGNGVGAGGCVSQGPITGACGSTPCMNGAACQNMGTNGYRCVCQAGYSGQNCETNVNECASNPCQNGGSCSDRVNSYMCQCPDSHTGSNCEVETSQCGAALTGESGTFRYPTVPDTQYPHDVSCAWRITTTRGKMLIVTFPTFNLEYHDNCNYDFVQVNDGPTAASHPIGRYCGNTTPNNGQPINTTDNQVYFWFKSDESVASDGFSVQWRSAMPVCGGHLDGADHGEFSSPGYPGNYPNDRDCVWTISVSPGKKIMFHFATLALEHHPDCNYDYVEIRDGGLDTSPVLRKYCNTTVPPPLTTTGPTARVAFHSDSNQNDQGFHITYAAIAADPGCGGTYTTETGVLISPNYPNTYNHDASCVWIIRVHDQDQVTLTFTNINLEGHSVCSYDYVEVRDGSDETSPLLGRYCGDSLPVPLTTTGNVMYVKFVTDSTVAMAGFRATWRVGCGGTFSSPTGLLRSPYYPDAYPSNRECEYFIVQPEGTRISLSFNAFDLEGDTTCSFDYLEIRDGGSSSSPLIGSFCGAQVPDPQMSTGNLMYLKFVTDGSVQNTGFEAAYTVEEQDCGGPLTSETGSLSSPGHPNTYPHGVNCTWYIHVEPGMVVRLTFHTFIMEYHVNCVYDSVALYDNSSAVESSLIGKYCGNNIPPVVTSTDNYMTVVLETDSSVASEGFTASYVALNASTLCGSELFDSTGVITSPNYPDNYPHQRDCTWIITAPEGNQILLNITDFSMENHPNCNYDYLEIRNGGFPSSPLAGKYCGTTVDRIIVSHSNRMFIRFVTDRSRSGQGFRLFYEATATGCGGDLTSASGSFVSPNYPMPYGHNAECFWTISVARGSKIQLAFVDMEIERHSRCYYDYVEVRNNGPNGILLGKFCGTSVPDPVISSGNVLWVKYRTDHSVARRGFHAFYHSICQNTLTGFSGVIESPNFPNPYPHNRNCTWIISAALGNTVNISFSHFNMESHSSCNYDYLQIRDGGNENSNEIGKYCGESLPDPIASTTDHVWIRFLSDYSVARNGFRLEYITNGCGAYFTSPTGTFTSPNYPNPYPNSRQCEWKIVVATGQAIKLTIDPFDLETHSTCQFDSLEVFGGPDDSAPRLTQLCHTQSSPQVLSTTGNEMFVRFKTDSSVTGNGFSASYETIPDGCGGNFTTRSGTILSKNYPNNYPHNTDCGWLITIEELYSIVLTFTDFDVEGSSDCRFDYVAVYDGPDSTYPEMMKYCGNSLPSPPIYRSQSNMMYVRMRTDPSASGRGFKAEYVTGCGGTINAETDGALISPNYPNSYPRSSNCSWLIQAAHGTDRITLTFTHLDLEEHGECSHDYVAVYNGNDEYAPEVGRYCGNTVPSAITSQGSALYVQFVSDYSVQGSGFRATYTKSTTVCGADFTASSGSFTSPGYPNSYPVSTECVWTMSVSPGSRVHLSFSMFNIEDHAYCNYDYVEIHEGQLGGPLLGRFCGNTVPSNLTAYNGLWVKFRSDEMNTGQGFIAQYSAVYGGEISGTSGQIGSPMYPLQYPHNAEYAWTITVPTGMRVHVTFVTMDMERSHDRGCVWDYVAFKDGGTVDSPEIGRYCAITIPEPFISSTNQLYVVFKSDWASTGQGFLFNWEATSNYPITTVMPTAGTTPIPGCGGTLNVTEDIQTLVSPGYPTGYQDGLNCDWTLNSVLGTRVWMNITYIDLESHSSCNYDYIRIYDGLFRRNLGDFCGRTGNTQPLYSRSNKAAVRFITDISRNNTGFALQYKAVCGGTFRRIKTGTLKSPRFPDNYPANSNCSWTLRASRGKTISVTFNNFNIQGNQGSCGGDYIQLLNGRSLSSPPLGDSSNGRYCGNSAPAPMETGGNGLNVLFVSDGSGSGSGFSLTFSEVSVTCGGELYLDLATTTGTFTSPNYPENYPHSVDCVWVITAPANLRIQLDFIESFNIERHSRCRWDFIDIRDGGTINSPSLAKVCGYTTPSSVVTTGNVMYVRFRTDSSVSRTGFKAQYTIATCGGRYTPTVGSPVTITSPNYPSNYDNNDDCVWIVGGPSGHFLTFTFNTFDLQSTDNCTSDSLEIRELNSTGPVLLHSCGNQNPAPVSTSDQYGHLRFKTDGSIQRAGFSVTVTASYEECGGDLNTPTGTFQSPNFPGNYPNSRRCTWKIMVPEGRRVSITFDSFNIQDHRYCRYDYVQVYNGIYSDSPRIGRYCGDSPPAVVQASGNTAKVDFRTDGSNSNGGFRATYNSLESAECGGRLLTAPGNITSPGFENGNYTNNLQCIWTLNNQQYVNSSVVIRFLVLQLERHTRCRYDWLELREGDSMDGLLLEKFCGNNTLPEPIITPLPSIWMRFRTDMSIVDHGFFLQYNFTQCGGILTSSPGVITSPNYPNDYDHNDACAWQINAPDGMRISLVLDDFDIERHSNCRYDYVEIFNGPYASSPSVGRFCGNNTPQAIHSQSSSLRLVFYTDYSMSARGFRANYTFESEGCGGTLHSPEGNFSTPNYPRSYPHNTECVWDINTDQGFFVNLTFNPPFDMENEGDCRFDYVEVSDALENGTLVPLGRWCGNVLPPPLQSSGRRLVVKFRSDPAANGNGFSANWVSGCGGYITGTQNGVLTSPGFPGQYRDNLRCNYTLQMEPEHFIVVRFDSNNFNIESATNCRFDFLAFYEGNSTEGRKLGKFCGRTAPQDLSALGQLYIQFWTDRSVTRTGFRFMYRVSECGGVYTGPTGLIRTPTHPINYHDNQNCTWSITVQENRVVNFKFTDFELEPHSTCSYDYVDILDGPTLSSPLIGRYCGEVVPRDMIKSTTNQMTLNFITDSSVTRGGFRGVYYETYGPAHGCGGYLNTTTGAFSSLDGDGDGQYENNLDCPWLIMAPNNKVVQLTFTGFDLEPHPSCRYDYVKIYDGMSTEDALVGTYCGTNIPPAFTSSSNALYVVFHTDVSVTGTGFNATYITQDALCGGAYVSTSAGQTITSPGYPSPFRQDVSCRWTIDAPTSTDIVEVNVTAIDLQSTTACSPEYLEIRDYPLGTQGRSVHFCGNSPPALFDSFGQTVQINYAATSGESRGFSLTYRTASCNRTYTDNKGQIYSPGWPGVYPHNANCQILIQGPQSSTVSLYFNSFQIEPHSNCNFDYLEIHNGTDASSPIIRKICGWMIPDPVFATTNSVWMNFVTDISVAHPGFDITYTTTTQGIGCGGNISGINGSLTSPGYPNNYTSQSTCTWLVTVPARRVITLTFTDMRMFDPVNCGTDYVTLYDGNSESANQFGRYCGGETPAPMTTSSNVGFVKFVSDGVGTSIGFRLTFTS